MPKFDRMMQRKRKWINRPTVPVLLLGFGGLRCCCCESVSAGVICCSPCDFPFYFIVFWSDIDAHYRLQPEQEIKATTNQSHEPKQPHEGTKFSQTTASNFKNVNATTTAPTNTTTATTATL